VAKDLLPPEGIPTSSSSIKLQILLRREWRSPDGLNKVKEILPSIGLTLTAAGATTISAEVEPKAFEETFGVVATESTRQLPGNNEFGRSAGHNSPDLKVPAALSDFVESISAAPAHSYFQK